MTDENDTMTHYSHAYDIAFELVSQDPEGKDVTPDMISDALVTRLMTMSDTETLEATGAPFDSYRMTNTDKEAWKQRHQPWSSGRNYKPRLAAALQPGEADTTMTAQQAVEAIRARISGEWDNPALQELGPLHPDAMMDIRRILDCARAL